ncbi:MAG: amidohydrolase family protein [Antricoccus sp.]
MRPVEALQAATSTAARVFGLHDRGVIEVGRLADLVLIAGDPLTEIKQTQLIEQVWVGGQSVDSTDYSGSDLE